MASSESPAPVPETLWTRQQYLRGECTHAQYYTQFVTPGVLACVKQAGLIALCARSRDPHYNDVPLSRWDACWPGEVPFAIDQKMRAAGDYPTPAGLVCLAKQAVQNYYAQQPPTPE